MQGCERGLSILQLSLLPFGYILQGRNPAAFLPRLFDYAERTPARGLYNPGVRFAFTHRGNDLSDELLGAAGQHSGLDHVKERVALQSSCRQPSQFLVTLIEQNDAAG